MKIVVLGTGYVGLVTGADFASRGVVVTCVDVNARRIAQLQAGTTPFYEPGLPELVAAGVAAGNLHFSTDAPAAIAGADAVLCAVGTPPQADGSADLSAVFACAEAFAAAIAAPSVFITKSTVPPGTGEQIRQRIAAGLAARTADIAFAVVANPEFLSQGTALADTANPARIVVGSDSDWAHRRMGELYASFIEAGIPYCAMSLASAETVKCAANAFLATKISLVNEVANFCSAVGAEVADVVEAIGLDPRIGRQFLRPGIGYGGSCLSKDVRALVARGHDVGYDFQILPAVEKVNDLQWRRLYAKLATELGGVAGKKIAVWGLSFKPDTGDTRHAPAFPFIHALLADGAEVVAVDPVVSATDVADELPGVVVYPDPMSSVPGADAIVLLTEWPVFRAVDLAAAAQAMRGSILADGRGAWGPEVEIQGFRYVAI